MANERYHGNPCGKCGNTERYVSSRVCVNNSSHPGQLERRREYAARYLENHGKTRHDPDKYRRFYLENADDIRAKKRQWGKTGRYGVTEEERVLLTGDGSCNICGRTFNRMCVDHDHSCCSGAGSCGECVRGLICNGCNSVLGHYEKWNLAGSGKEPQFDEYLARPKGWWRKNGTGQVEDPGVVS